MPRLNDDSHRFWDLVLKAGSAIGFIVAALFSYHQYLDQATRETRKPFLEKQLATCVEAADSAATIATSPEPANVAAAKVTLDRLYFGTLAIFDNKAIAVAVREFNNALKTQSSEDNFMANKSLRDTLSRVSVDIAHACRDLMIASWFSRDPGMVSYSKTEGSKSEEPRASGPSSPSGGRGPERPPPAP